MRAEVYHKTYDRYVEGEGGSAGVDGAPSAKQGSSSGADILAQWNGTGPVTGWVTYPFLHANTRLSDGRRVPSAFDVRHTATAVGRAALGPAWEVALTGRYATGRPFTPIEGAAPSPTVIAEAPARPIVVRPWVSGPAGEEGSRGVGLQVRIGR